MLKLFALVLVLSFVPLTTASAADVEAGRQVYKRCGNCHSDAGENKLGPSLVSILGRTAGTAEGYNYSTAMKEAGQKGLVWNENTLDGYMQSPVKFIGKQHKCFVSRVPEPKDRENLIAYLTELPKVAVANRLAREAKQEEDRKRARQAERERAMRQYQEQLLRSKEALLIGAGPGSFDAGGFLRPRLLTLAYEGRFEELAPEDFPAEYYYRFAETVSARCPHSGMDGAQLRFGTNLFERGFDKDFQEEVVTHMFKMLPEMMRNPGALIARAAEKEAALKAGPQDAEGFLKRYQCDKDSGVAKRMFANVGAALGGGAPVYVDHPKRPELADE